MNLVLPVGEQTKGEVAQVDVEVRVEGLEALEHGLEVGRHVAVARHDVSQVLVAALARVRGANEVEVELLESVVADELHVVGGGAVAVLVDAGVGRHPLTELAQVSDPRHEPGERAGFFRDRVVRNLVAALDRKAPQKIPELDHLFAKGPSGGLDPVGEDDDLVEAERHGLLQGGDEGGLQGGLTTEQCDSLGPSTARMAESLEHGFGVLRPRPTLLRHLPADAKAAAVVAHVTHLDFHLGALLDGNFVAVGPKVVLRRLAGAQHR